MPRISYQKKVGCLFKDVPRLLPALFLRRNWIRAWNRNDNLCVEQGGVNTAAVGPWSADLYAAHVFPWIGRRLMSHALQTWPLRHLDRVHRHSTSAPQVSFIIPHRGKERLPLLIATVRTILAQRDIQVECIVVEQSARREVTGLPPGTQYIHLPHSEDPHSWRKCWAYNAGARVAEGRILVCHDGDILVSADYAREIVRTICDQGNEVAHLQRFLFCLSAEDTDHFIATGTVPDRCVPERIRQNWKGGTLAVKKDRYFELGGFDERFIDWSGEDREFYDRCLSLKGWRWGYLPFIHLWHPSQESKVSPEERRASLERSEGLMAVSREERINILRTRLAALSSVAEQEKETL